MLSLGDKLPEGSVENVELIMALEEAFDIRIPDEDADQIRSVEDAVDYIPRKKGDSN